MHAQCSNYRSILSSGSYYLEDFDYWSILVNSGIIVQCRMFRSGVSDTNPTKTSLSVAPVTSIFESYRHFGIKSHLLHFNHGDIRKLVVDFYSTKHWLTRYRFSATYCFNCTMCKIIRHQTSYLLLHSSFYIILAKTRKHLLQDATRDQETQY